MHVKPLKPLLVPAILLYVILCSLHVQGMDLYNILDAEPPRVTDEGVLFTFKTFLRWGDVFPFFGAGLGNYYVNYDEAMSGISFRDSPDSVYNARVGVRILVGRLGLLAEAGNTHAQLPIVTGSGPATLELGGNYSNVGLSWAF